MKKTVLITGGASGIGFATAKHFLKNGCNVAIIDIRADLEDSVRSELSALGNVNYTVCDLSDTENIEYAVQKSIQPFGSLDILVNNAGIGGHDFVMDITEKKWNDFMNISLKAMFFVAQSAGKIMIENKSSGAIINLSSIRADYADGTHMLYSIAKNGICAMTRELALAFGNYGIRVNNLKVGFALTQMSQHYLNENPKMEDIIKERSALPIIQTPEDIANIIYFLTSDANVAITGQSITTDAGATLLAGLFTKTSHA